MTQTGIILKDTGPLILSTIYDMTMWMGFNVTLKLSWQHRNLNTLTSMQTTVVSLCVIAHVHNNSADLYLDACATLASTSPRRTDDDNDVNADLDLDACASLTSISLGRTDDDNDVSADLDTHVCIGFLNCSYFKGNYA